MVADVAEQVGARSGGGEGGEDRFVLPVLEPAIADGQGGVAVAVNTGFVVGGHGDGGAGDFKRAIDIGEVVVACCCAAGGDGVVAHVAEQVGARGGSGEGGEDRFVLPVLEPAVADGEGGVCLTIDAGFVVGSDRNGCFGHRHRAVGDDGGIIATQCKIAINNMGRARVIKHRSAGDMHVAAQHHIADQVAAQQAGMAEGEGRQAVAIDLVLVVDRQVQERVAVEEDIAGLRHAIGAVAGVAAGAAHGAAHQIAPVVEVLIHGIDEVAPAARLDGIGAALIVENAARGGEDKAGAAGLVGGLRACQHQIAAGDKAHRVGPVMCADGHDAAAIGAADGEVAPAIHHLRQLGAGDPEGAGLRIAHADAGRVAHRCDGQHTRAGEGAIEYEIGIRDERQVVAARILVAGDAQQAGAGLEGYGIGPGAGIDVHGARAIGAAENDVFPAIEDAGQLDGGDVQRADAAADANRAADARGLDGQRAGARKRAVERQIAVAADGQVVRPHRLGAGDGDDARTRLQQHRIAPCIGAGRQPARAVLAAEYQLAPALRDAVEFADAEVDGTRAARQPDAGADARTFEGEDAGAGQRGVDGRIVAGAEGQVVGAHVLRAMDGDDPRAAGEGDRVVPCAARHIDDAAAIGAAEHHVAPAAGDARQFGVADAHGARHAIAHAHRAVGGRAAQVQGAGAGQRGVDNGVAVGGERQVVRAHVLYAGNGQGAGAVLEGDVVAPGACAHVHGCSAARIAEDDLAPAARLDEVQLVIIQIQHAALTGADAHGRAVGGQDGQDAGAGKGLCNGQIGAGTDDQVVRPHADRPVDIQRARQRAQVEVTVPAAAAHVEGARHAGGADDNGAPARAHAVEHRIIELDGAGLAVAKADAGGGAAAHQHQRAGAVHHGQQVGGGVAAEGQVVRKGIQRPVDIERPAARAQVKMVVPRGCAHIQFSTHAGGAKVNCVPTIYYIC